MRPTRTVYHLIDSKWITPELYHSDALDKYASSVNAWRDSFLSALSDLGVTLQEYLVSDEDSFLKSPDGISSLADVLPVNTYGYGYQYNDSPTPDDSIVMQEYPTKNKYVAFHFQMNGSTFSAVLLFSKDMNSKVTLTFKADNLSPESYFMADSFKPNGSFTVGLLLKALLEAYFKTGKLPLARTSDATQELVTAYQQSQKDGSKKKVKSALSLFSPHLTQHDIETLLSSSNPSHVWWSPLLNKVAVKDSRGWYVASFRYLSSGWTLDWFTLSATPLKSNGHKYIRYSGSCLFPLD